SEAGNFENMSFVLDGDVYRTDEDKRAQINRVLTGNVPDYIRMRDVAFSKITQLNIPQDISPERYYKQIIIALPTEKLNRKQIELKEILQGIENPPDDHDFVTILVERIGLEEGEVLTILADMICLTDEWSNITSSVHEWFNQR